MNGISDIITKLYKRFFLRDLLSYVCPGLIVITSIYFFSCRSYIFKVNFGAGILIFLFSFVIGLAINALVEFMFRDVTKDKFFDGKRVNYYLRRIKIESIQGDLTFDQNGSRKKLNEKKQNFLYIFEQRDHYIVLKQMSRNNMGAVLISFVLLIIYNPPVFYNIMLAYVGYALLFVGLLISACKSFRNQTDFEYTLNHCFQATSNGRIEELIENGEHKKSKEKEDKI